MKLRKYLPKFYVRLVEKSYRKWVGVNRGRISDKNFELTFLVRIARLVIIVMFVFIVAQGGLENANSMKYIGIGIGIILILLLRFLSVM